MSNINDINSLKDSFNVTLDALHKYIDARLNDIRSDIDFIAMETGVDMTQDEEHEE